MAAFLTYLVLGSHCRARTYPLSVGGLPPQPLNLGWGRVEVWLRIAPSHPCHLHGKRPLHRPRVSQLPSSLL